MRLAASTTPSQTWFVKCSCCSSYSFFSSASLLLGFVFLVFTHVIYFFWHEEGIFVPKIWQNQLFVKLAFIYIYIYIIPKPFQLSCLWKQTLSLYFSRQLPNLHFEILEFLKEIIKCLVTRIKTFVRFCSRLISVNRFFYCIYVQKRIGGVIPMGAFSTWFCCIFDNTLDSHVESFVKYKCLL